VEGAGVMEEVLDSVVATILRSENGTETLGRTNSVDMVANTRWFLKTSDADHPMMDAAEIGTNAADHGLPHEIEMMGRMGGDIHLVTTGIVGEGQDTCPYQKCIVYKQVGYSHPTITLFWAVSLSGLCRFPR